MRTVQACWSLVAIGGGMVALASAKLALELLLDPSCSLGQPSGCSLATLSSLVVLVDGVCVIGFAIWAFRAAKNREPIGPGKDLRRNDIPMARQELVDFLRFAVLGRLPGRHPFRGIYIGTALLGGLDSIRIAADSWSGGLDGPLAIVRIGVSIGFVGLFPMIWIPNFAAESLLVGQGGRRSPFLVLETKADGFHVAHNLLGARRSYDGKWNDFEVVRPAKKQLMLRHKAIRWRLIPVPLAPERTDTTLESLPRTLFPPGEVWAFSPA